MLPASDLCSPASTANDLENPQQIATLSSQDNSKHILSQWENWRHFLFGNIYLDYFLKGMYAILKKNPRGVYEFINLLRDRPQNHTRASV